MALPPLPGTDDSSDLSEAQFNRLAMKSAIESVLNDPVRAVMLVPAKVFHLWAGHRHAIQHNLNASDTKIPTLPSKLLPVITQSVLYTFFLLTGISFLKYPGPRYWLRYPASTVPLILVSWTMFHLAVFGAGRFHVPIEVVLIMASVVALRELARRFAPQFGVRSNIGRTA